MNQKPLTREEIESFMPKNRFDGVMFDHTKAPSAAQQQILCDMALSSLPIDRPLGDGNLEPYHSAAPGRPVRPENVRCKDCDGEGRIPFSGSMGKVDTWQSCFKCKGSGYQEPSAEDWKAYATFLEVHISNGNDVISSMQEEITSLESLLTSEQAAGEELAEALAKNMQWIGPPPTDDHSFDSLREDAWALGNKALSNFRSTKETRK